MKASSGTNNKSILFFILTFICISFELPELQAQDTDSVGNGYKIGGKFYYGKILVHSSKLSHFKEGYSQIYEATFLKQTDGSKLWQQKSNYPFVGFSLLYSTFGYPEILGTAVSVLPRFVFRIMTRKHLGLFSEFVYGISYLSKQYDLVDNPLNVVISTRINNIMQLTLGCNLKINTRFSLTSGLGLTHFSNGAYKLPNLGLNVPVINMGFLYNLDNDPQLIKNDAPEPISNNESISIQMASGMKSYRTPGGPKYWSHNLSISKSIKKTYISNFQVGTDLIYDGATYHFIKNNGPISDQDLKRSLKGGIFISYELMVNKLGIMFHLGGYYYNPFLGRSWIYQRWTTRYYITKNIYASVNLKNHLFVADVITWGLGVSL